MILPPHLYPSPLFDNMMSGNISYNCCRLTMITMGEVLNIHNNLPLPDGVSRDTVAIVKGSYGYYHYNMDGIDDRVRIKLLSF